MNDNDWAEVRGSKVSRKHKNIDFIELHQKIKYIIDQEINKCIGNKKITKNKYTTWIVK